jgi:hypothetical protein
MVIMTSPYLKPETEMNAPDWILALAMGAFIGAMLGLAV